MAVKLRLSRENMYTPITDLGFDVADITLSAFAFMPEGEEPLEADWETATLVDDDTHPLWVPAIGPAYSILIGPTRGDSVTTLDLGVADYQVWTDTKVTGSDERVVRIAGLLEIELV